MSMNNSNKRALLSGETDLVRTIWRDRYGADPNFDYFRHGNKQELTIVREQMIIEILYK